MRKVIEIDVNVCNHDGEHIFITCDLHLIVQERKKRMIENFIHIYRLEERPLAAVM